MQNIFINLALLQALTNPFLINNITNSVISNKLITQNEESNANIAPKKKIK